MAPIFDYNAKLAQDDVIEGVGITVGAMQGVARRQLAGSIVVAMLVAAVAAMTTMSSARHETGYATARYAPVVQQPTFVASPDRVVAAAKRQTELP
ncbi:MAG TPA: hypothetical protein VKS78_14800 [Roseiarcus sp.]|nr:hypothetical protein [Roseiarcus sp.]